MRVQGAGRPRVALVQPYVPAYRREFFIQLRDELRKRGVALRLYVGSPFGSQARRGDSVQLDFAQRVPQLALDFGKRAVIIRLLPRDALTSDLLILEQSIRNVETYPALLRRGPTGVWGHGHNVTTKTWRFQKRLHSWVLRRSSWFFAYTEASAARGMELGARSDSTSVLNNTIDVAELAAEVALLPDRTSHLDESGRFVALHVGGLDDAKRIPLLLETAELIYRRNPTFLLVVAGEGALRKLVEAHSDQPWIEYVGFVDAEAKAKEGRRAQLMLVPGRVGLIAVDSFVLGTPIVASASALHAPEFEYLNESNSLVVPGGANELADAVLGLMQDPVRLYSLQQGALESSKTYTLTRMVQAFADGVVGALK